MVTGVAFDMRKVRKLWFDQKGAIFGGSWMSRSQQQCHVNLPHKDSRKEIAMLVIRLFDKWGLSTVEKLGLLGLSPTSRKMICNYRKGISRPNSRDMLDRIGWLLSIHKALRVLYPRNDHIRYSWVKRKNQFLNNQRPLDIMQDQGLIGLAKISRYLDHLKGL